MSQPIRVAQVMGAMVGGGLEATIMNHYRFLDHDKVQFDFIVQDDSTHVPEREIESYGGRIYTIPSYKKINSYMSSLSKLFTELSPDIVHSNMNALSVFPLKAAKKVGVPIRTAHSHSTANKKEIARTAIKDALRPFSKVYPTHLAACGRYSAEWLFGKKSVAHGDVHYIKNAIDLNKFSYQEEARNQLRSELGIEDKFVVGQIGRFTSQKNHLFSMDVFAELHRRMPNSVFVMLGSGELMDDVKHKAHELGLDDSTYFLGQRGDAERWYSVFDVLLFPSLYEGLPLTAIEAQAAGLPIVASNTITEEAFIEKDLTYVLTLQDSADVWAQQLASLYRKRIRRSNRFVSLREQGYDISSSTQDLQTWYMRIIGEERI